MRKTAKAILLVFVALIGSLGLTVGAAFSAAFAFGAVALIVPGTGTHNVDDIPNYRGNAALRYIDPVPGGPTVCSDANNPNSCNTVGVPYPATFFPLVIFSGWCPGLNCDTWNQSVGAGVQQLNAEFYQNYDPTNPNQQDVVIFGYSQGGAVVSKELYALNADPSIDRSKVSVVTIGNISNPDGLWTRLSFLPTIPGLDITFGPTLPTDGIKSTNYSFEYDPVGDAPEYWGNPVAMLNALAAFEYVHGYYLSPNENGPTDALPYGYAAGPNGTLAAAINNPNNSQSYQNATFILIPQQGALPIYQPFVDLANTTGTRALVDPVISLVQPVTKVLVNLGYARDVNPGIPQTLSILPANPFQNWFKVGGDLVGASVEGVENVVTGNDVTQVPTTVPADASTPSTNTITTTPTITQDTVQTATLAAKKTPTTTVTTPKTKDTVANLTAVLNKQKSSADKVGNKLKSAADKVGSQVKATVNKISDAVKKAVTPKKTASTETKAKDAA
jgi:hypothetical protein